MIKNVGKITCCLPTFIYKNFISGLPRDKLVPCSLGLTFIISHTSTGTYIILYEYWFAARNIHNNKAFANLTIFSCIQMKVGLKYVNYFHKNIFF